MWMLVGKRVRVLSSLGCSNDLCRRSRDAYEESLLVRLDAPISVGSDLMAYVEMRDGEPPEGIVSRFRAAVTRNGILKEHKDRRFFRSKGEQTRLDKARSLRRLRRRMRR